MNDSSDCPSITERLPEYLAGRVSTGEDARIRAHLESCPDCRTRANAVSLLQQTPVPAPDPDRWDDFVGGVVRAAEEGRSRSPRRVWILAVAAAAVVAVALLAWTLIADRVTAPGPRLDVIAREAADLPEEEAAAWTVGVGAEPWIPAGSDLEGLSDGELDRLLKEVEES